MEAISSFFWLLVTMSVIVGFHEFGHFQVARWVGVQVTRFSLGFGPRLFSRTDRHGTEFQVAAIPLGGYVKMTDTREGDVDPSNWSRAFDRQSVGRRMAVVAAGPGANIVLTVVLFWLVAIIGTPFYAAKVGEASAALQSMGLRTGDVVTAVDGQTVADAETLNTELLSAAIDRRDALLRVEGADGSQRSATLPYSKLPRTASTVEAFNAYRFPLAHELVPAVIGVLPAQSPNQSRLQAGDRLLQLNGVPVRYWHELAPVLRTLPATATTVSAAIERDGLRKSVDLTLLRTPDSATPKLGIQAVTQAPKADGVQRLNPLTAVPKALRDTWAATRMMGDMAYKAFTGKLELNLTVAGPVTTARVSNAVAQSGAAQYLKLLALLSLSVAILNLLPIPVLDGGHLLYYLIEWVKGSPVHERIQRLGNAVGLALIFSLMGLAFFNDFVNNFR